ncbi:MAG: hypothetical protein QXD62_00770 [Candidatus Woesearchaeota archaeon]
MSKELEFIWDLDSYSETIKPRLEEIAKRYGSHIIRRDTPIDNGIYFDRDGDEGIYVKLNKGVETPLKILYRNVVERKNANFSYNLYLDENSPQIDLLTDLLFIEHAYDFVRNYFEKNSEKLKDIATRLKGSDNILYLDNFVLERVGDARHYALTLGAILEYAMNKGILKNVKKVSIDSNAAYRPVSENQKEHVLDHVWCRLEIDRRKPLVLDPYFNYLGPVDVPVKTKNWDYRRPDEK